MDVLSDVLRVVQLSGAVFFTADFSSPWALESPSPERLASAVMPDAECVVLFHILVEGECEVACPGHPTTTMEGGDVIVFPRGDQHTMRSRGAAAATPLASIFSPGRYDEPPQLSFGGGGSTSRFVCGYLNCDQRFSPLVEALPTMLLVRSRGEYSAIEAIERDGGRPIVVPPGSGTWLGTTLKFTIAEARTARPGNAAMLGRLTELMFVGILREYMHRLPTDQGGWFAGLNDACIGRALRLLHANPARDWTVDDLAREVAVSRSVLAQRFTELVGEAPMRYLANWRMQLAKQMMRTGTGNIQDVATRVGYDSEAAFNRAFKRATGSPPGTWRRSAIGT
ncbi:MAG TPA: AraC family transcriptional regulator [Vicinamibacterales bacterium]|nr:AraC family transcriptional regulator [Vicinamibacterales bacterium]